MKRLEFKVNSQCLGIDAQNNVCKFNSPTSVKPREARFKRLYISNIRSQKIRIF